MRPLIILQAEVQLDAPDNDFQILRHFLLLLLWKRRLELGEDFFPLLALLLFISERGLRHQLVVLAQPLPRSILWIVLILNLHQLLGELVAGRDPGGHGLVLREDGSGHEGGEED